MFTGIKVWRGFSYKPRLGSKAAVPIRALWPSVVQGRYLFYLFGILQTMDMGINCGIVGHFFMALLRLNFKNKAHFTIDIIPSFIVKNIHYVTF